MKTAIKGLLFLLVVSVAFSAGTPNVSAHALPGNWPRPVFPTEQTAYTTNVNSNMISHQQDGITYWYLTSFYYTINSYNLSQFGPWDNTTKVDLIFDAVYEGQQGCYFSHCVPAMPGPSGDRFTLAQWWRFDEINVAVVQWNASRYSDSRDPVDGVAANSVLMRHELGHDHFLADHGDPPEPTYSGLMCGVYGDPSYCTPLSAGTPEELTTASSQFTGRPQAPTGISVGPVTYNSVRVDFSGGSGPDGFKPYRSTSLTGWYNPGTIGSGSTSYNFTGLTPSTTYYFRIAATKSGWPESTSWWVTATTSPPPGADLIVTAAPISTSKNEGTQATFSITVKNQGTAAAGPFAAGLKFTGSYRPYPQGLCAFNDGLAAGAQQACTTGSVDMNFAGGPMVAVVDIWGQVAETNEGNNELAGGTLGVKPTPPDESTNDIITWPPGGWGGPSGGWYGWKDRSAIETGFTVKVQRASSCSGSWTTVKTSSHGAKSGVGQNTYVAYTFAHGYCWRIQVRANGQFADSSYVIDQGPYWWP